MTAIFLVKGDLVEDGVRRGFQQLIVTPSADSLPNTKDALEPGQTLAAMKQTTLLVEFDNKRDIDVVALQK